MTESEPGGARDPIREALRQLPRETASTGFTRRLLVRAENREPRRVTAWPRLAAAALLLAVIAGGFFVTRQRIQRLDYQRQRAALEDQHEQLRRELAAVRELAVRPPRLYLGTASDVDLVLDLEPWMEQPLAVRPAAYSDSRPRHAETRR